MIKAWDADGHGIEWEGTFADKYFDRAWATRRPKVVESNSHVHWLIDSQISPANYGRARHFTGSPASINGRRQEGLLKKKESLECLELRGPSDRLALMDEEGIELSVIYPTLFLVRPLSRDPGFEAVLCRSYNNWIADVCGQSGGRLRWVSVVDASDPRESAAEIARTAAMGAVGVMLPGMVGEDSIAVPRFEPIWEAAAKHDQAVGVHVAYCTPLESHYTFFYSLLIAFDQIIPYGILDRYPDLRVGFLEAGCSWVPWRIERMEERMNPGKVSARSAPGRPRDTIFDDPSANGYRAKLAPREYLKRGSVYFGFEVDEALLPYCIKFLGANCLVWGSDIPHADREAYGARELQQRRDISDEDKWKLLVGNAAAFYKIQIPEKQRMAS
jgi:uncharacterized protein